MSMRRTLAVGGAALLGAVGCAGSATIDEVAASSTSTTTTTEAPAEGVPAPTEDLLEAPGLIAIGGSPVRLVDSTGEAVDDAASLGVQPTWARDGSRLVVSSPDGGAGSVAVWPDDTDAPAVRSYFFFSWNHDGTRIAALGPGRLGTTLDILDEAGQPVEEAVVEGGSVFVAWERGGRLIVHADSELLLIEPAPGDDEGAVPYTRRSLGPVGLGFFAPKWVPGTSEVVYATAAGVLVRHDVDTGVITDLGAARGSVAIAVHPDGDRAAITHSLGTDDGGREAITAGPVQDTVAAVEIVDLTTGARTAVYDQPALWTEWSPDGTHLLLATLMRDAHAEWLLWDGEEVAEVATWVPTLTFLTRYMAFSDQYVEQPRLWAPDGSAFVYPSVVAVEAGEPVERIHVVAAAPDAQPVAIADGAAAFWSPVAPTP